MQLPASIQPAAGRALRDCFGGAGTIQAVSPLSGGCIHTTCRLSTEAGPVCLKYNQRPAAARMFSTEARDLELLRAQAALRVPKVFALDELPGGGGLILMEYLAAAPRRATYWEDFGAGLARLHGATQAQFGLGYDNHIGALPQSNRKHADWPAFFAAERLRPQIDLLAGQSGDSGFGHLLDQLQPKLGSLFPSHPPALLHGDLWSGNVLVDDAGGPAVIDPAVYYGHPEMDLAFTQLFGRFPQAFYEAYEAVRPLEPGFEERRDLYNLYPLLVHANLFGGGYVQEARAVFRRYV